MSSRLRIVVGGIAGLTPVAGHALHYLQYALGLSRLGHDVVYHEDTWSWPYHPLERTFTDDGGYTTEFLGSLFARFAPELAERWHYLHLHEHSCGMSRNAFRDFARTADLFVNVGGACMIPDELAHDCVTVFLDTDPGYNQIMLAERLDWSENVDRWCDSVAAHDRHVTFAENIHEPDCEVPKLDFDWLTTRMPVVVDLWEPARRAPAAGADAWSTVMTWNPFKGALVHRGVEYHGKDTEFERIAPLPRRTGMRMRVAIGGVNAPKERLAAQGWEVVDGPSATLTGDAYQGFIAASRGEISPAKQVYVALRTGWFSERSTCYLASGRPVVVQDTGFAAHLPTGEGILAFATTDEAAAALEAVEADRDRHERAALDLAREEFGSDRVLARLVDDVFATTPERGS